jgi:organic radical activating enzyme
VYTERKATKHSRIDVPFNVREEARRMTPAEVQEELEGLGCTSKDLIVISGGEPMLQQPALSDLLSLLYGYAWAGRLSVETAGTVAPEEWWEEDVLFNVSPKLAGSGNALDRRYNIDAIDAFNRKEADFKFVISNWNDAREAEEFVRNNMLDKKRVWVMPEGIDASTVVARGKWMADWAAEQGYNLTLRQHILLYGDERKR